MGLLVDAFPGGFPQVCSRSHSRRPQGAGDDRFEGLTPIAACLEGGRCRQTMLPATGLSDRQNSVGAKQLIQAVSEYLTAL